jgi:hypothetical protein
MSPLLALKRLSTPPPEGPVTEVLRKRAGAEPDSRPDAAGGEIDREHAAERERACVRGGEHLMDFLGERNRHLRRPGGEQQVCDPVGSAEPNKPANDVSTMKNGNIAISTDSAM